MGFDFFGGVSFWGRNERGKAGGAGSGPGGGGQEAVCVSGDMRCGSVISHVL